MFSKKLLGLATAAGATVTGVALPAAAVAPLSGITVTQPSGSTSSAKLCAPDSTGAWACTALDISKLADFATDPQYDGATNTFALTGTQTDATYTPACSSTATQELVLSNDQQPTTLKYCLDKGVWAVLQPSTTDGITVTSAATTGVTTVEFTGINTVPADPTPAPVTPTPTPAPAAQDDSYSLALGNASTATIDVLANDGATVEASTLKFLTNGGTTTSNSLGSFAVKNGKVVFTSNGTAGTATVTYSVADASGNASNATLTVTTTGSTPSPTPTPEPPTPTPTVAPTETATPTPTPPPSPTDDSSPRATPTTSATPTPKPSTPAAPVAQADSGTVALGDSLTLDVLANDKGTVDASTLAFLVNGVSTKSYTTAQGVFSISGGRVVFTSSGTAGTSKVTYKVANSSGQATQAQVTVTAAAGNVPDLTGATGGTTKTPTGATKPPGSSSTGKTSSGTTSQGPTKALGGKTKLADQKSGAATGTTITTATGSQEKLTTDDAAAVDNSADTSAGQFTSCTQAVAAGYGSTPRTSPHYQMNLDADGDGVMCETRIASGAARETTNSVLVAGGSLLMGVGLLGAGALALGDRRLKVAALRIR